MDLQTERSYTLAELSAEIGRRLAGSGVEPVSGRVSPVPDGRTLRYYTTIGLLDRPLEVRDRQARYGERHVLQALAIKSLQAGGLSLARIQTALAGLDDRELAAVAAGGTRRRDPERQRFWSHPTTLQSPPAPAGAAPSGPGGAFSPPAPTPTESTIVVGRVRAALPAVRSARGAGGAHLQTVLPLAGGLSLVLEGDWSHDQLDMLRLAAAPVLEAWSHHAPGAAEDAAAENATTHRATSHRAGAPTAARPRPDEEQS